MRAQANTEKATELVDPSQTWRVFASRDVSVSVFQEHFGVKSVKRKLQNREKGWRSAKIMVGFITYGASGDVSLYFY